MEGFEITAEKPVTAVQLRGSHCEILDNCIHDMKAAVNGTYGEPSPDGAARDYSAVAHNRIAYNKVYHCEYGFILGGNDWLVENNEVRRLFMYASGNHYDDCDYTRFFGKGCIQRYNYYHGTLTSEIKDAHVDGIQTFMNNGGMAQDLLFEFNTCFDWGQGAMVESAPHIGNVRNWTWRHNIYSSNLSTYKGAWGLNVIQTPDATIENNTFAGITWFGVGLRGKESTGGQIRNNLICEVQQAVVDGDRHFSAANPVVEYNLTFNTAPLAAEANINGKDPLFVDPQWRSFRLKNGSPAVGAGKGGVTIGALEYPNVYYVDPRHPAAADEPAWGYPAVPLSSLAKACALAQPGETIVLRGGVYRETLRPKRHGVTVRAMKGEMVTISGADLIEGWKREADGSWSAPLPSKPKQVLRDGQPWGEFTYDLAAKRIVVKSGDPRLHLFETVVREQGIDLGGQKDVKVEDITVASNTLKEGRIKLASEEPSAYQETVAIAPITPEEPLRKQYSVEAGGDYLDTVALNWQREQKCLACHATFAYLIARPAVSWDVPAHRQIRLAAERAVEREGLLAKEPKRSSQAVLLAAALAVNDAQTTHTLHPLTRRALDRMWTLERDDGTWPWPIGCKWPPSEIDEFYGVAVAALAAGVVPGEYRQTPQAKQGLEKIRGFFSRNPPATAYQRGLLLWVSRYLDGIMGEAQKKAAVDELLTLQRPDGGWAFAALGNWQRSDGKPQDTRTSDGYGTGFVVYVLRMAGLPAQHPQIQKGIGWLKTHQRSSGRWYTRSANKDSKHLIANEGTAFALMALAACDELGLRRQNPGQSQIP